MENALKTDVNCWNCGNALGSLAVPDGSARTWKCDLGNGQWDHDWKEKHDDAGQVDGGPGDYWSWRECRVCGAIEEAQNTSGERPAKTKES